MKENKNISIIKLLDDQNSFMILNPLKKESIENITPIPRLTELGLPLNSIEENSRSNLIELVPFPCSCGKELGIYLRVISILSLQEKEFNENIALKFDLNGCCRMKILAPIVDSVISKDINAKVIENYENNEDGYKWPGYKLF